MFRRFVTAGMLAAALLAMPFAVGTANSPVQPAGSWIPSGGWELDAYLNTARIATSSSQKGVLLSTDGDRTYASRTRDSGASWSSWSVVPDGNWKTFGLDASWIGLKVDLLRTAWKGSDSALRYQRSTDGGKTWSAAMKLAGATSGGEQVARSTDGTVAVAYWSGNSLKVRVSGNNGQSFSAAKTVGTYAFEGFAFDPGAIGLDVANGTVVVTFWNNDHTFSTRRSTNRGSTWSPRKTLASGDQVSPNEVATAGNNVMVVYGVASTLYSRLSHDKGKTWDGAVTVAPVSDAFTLGRPGGYWSVAYSATDRLRYKQSSNGTSWSSADLVDELPGATFTPQNIGSLFAAPAIAYIYEQTGDPELLQVAIRQ